MHHAVASARRACSPGPGRRCGPAWIARPDLAHEDGARVHALAARSASRRGAGRCCRGRCESCPVPFCVPWRSLALDLLDADLACSPGGGPMLAAIALAALGLEDRDLLAAALADDRRDDLGAGDESACRCAASPSPPTSSTSPSSMVVADGAGQASRPHAPRRARREPACRRCGPPRTSRLLALLGTRQYREFARPRQPLRRGSAPPARVQRRRTPRGPSARRRTAPLRAPRGSRPASGSEALGSAAGSGCGSSAPASGSGAGPGRASASGSSTGGPGVERDHLELLLVHARAGADLDLAAELGARARASASRAGAEQQLGDARRTPRSRSAARRSAAGPCGSRAAPCSATLSREST